mmetsp:Transcript_104335/g.185517  ORF Transcript_104335/g.185517 Transcript_104335/m.185517 type:complete len:158 (-) Transcript_104335:110-583(-)|eukprot:CAMPEP_0197700902 /NCGR_PEP_ID=MMETSP1338-20131121/122559_1 /TAXON_ID=43686 ORGANISM="Pelagodinium beii, Strain RCC1491" /NCGR_SAMPLE_ID=MMETSP1338 /ASSEMBLY_ACC=CAM_ASM_000754 /LENGTH=157 /DNA_ID=CAMNT_0043284553 /DNA_START=74 /DNA_END=547 /DNA_ORIENTATION=+
MKAAVFVVACLAVLAVAAAASNATVSDCGTSSTHTKFKALSVSPNPPVKGKLATVTASGSLDESVSKAGYSFAVSLDGNELYTHSGDACGTDVINLPLNMGQITTHGFTCPQAAGDVKVSFGMILPTGVPPGNYELKWTATDGSGSSLWCVGVDFSF